MNTQTTPAFFSRLPWEKMLIWGLFLAFAYILNHFFFVIFMTFIISFCMRGLVTRITRRLSPGKERGWLQLLVSIVCFLLLLLSLYGAARFFIPRLVAQGGALVKKFSNLEKSPRATLDDILRDTVGTWLFQQEFGGPDDARYQTALKASSERGGHLREYERFRELLTLLDDDIESATPESERAIIRELRSKNGAEYSKRVVAAYTARRKANDPKAGFDIPLFVKLREAHNQNAQAFAKLYDATFPQTETPREQQERERLGFEMHAKSELVKEWKKGEIAEKLEVQLQETIVAGFARIGRNLGEMIPKIITLPIQLVLALMLSFFITIDVPRLAKGLKRLEQSRASNFYEEIAPGLISFGRLIGRAFQAQGVIALVNTVLTLAALKLLNVENEIFLSAIVFICSFIPVLGTVFSSVPIAAMAMIQDGGSFMLAVWIVVAILVIHFIETSILNPKIVGEMLHLHPVMVLAILTISEHFFGIWGLLLGCPIMVYIIRFVIFDDGIPGVIEPIRRKPAHA
jgi:predicted PurR-regulated permease PerM